MTQSGLALGRRVGRDQPVMFGKPRQGDLQNDLPGARRPDICLLGLLETFQLAAKSTRIPETFGPTAGNHLVAKRGRVRRRPAPRAVLRRERRPVRGDPRVHMREPVIRAQTLTSFVWGSE